MDWVFFLAVPAQAEAGAVTVSWFFTVELCLHEQLKLLSKADDHILICPMKTTGFE